MPNCSSHPPRPPVRAQPRNIMLQGGRTDRRGFVLQLSDYSLARFVAPGDAFSTSGMDGGCTPPSVRFPVEHGVALRVGSRFAFEARLATGHRSAAARRGFAGDEAGLRHTSFTA